MYYQYNTCLGCSLAPRGVGFKSMYQSPKHRVEVGREDNSCVRPPMSELLSESSQKSTIKNANQVLLGTQ